MGKENYHTKKRSTNVSLYSKVPPQDTDVEEVVLGSIMLEKTPLSIAIEILKVETAFYKDAHQKIFSAILHMHANGSPVDILTVTKELRNRGELDLVGGPEYITSLTYSISSTAHIEAHCRIIKELAIRREIIAACATGLGKAYDEGEDVFNTEMEILKRIGDISVSAAKKPYEHVKESVSELLQDIDDARSKGVVFTGINTGHKKMNALTGGLQKAELIVFAARPGVGKTVLALNFGLVCAQDKQYGGPVGIFSCEMTKKQVTKRMLANIAQVNGKLFRTPSKFTAQQLEQLTIAAGKLSDLPIHIDDTPQLTIQELRAKARRMKEEHGIVLLIVDYIQLLKGSSGKYMNRSEEIGEITGGLKILSKDLDIPVLALCQINREVEKQRKVPELSDLKDSGSIEQDADMVMFLQGYSQDVIEKEPSKRFMIAGIIKKFREGEQGEESNMIFHIDNKIQRWSDSRENLRNGTYSKPEIELDIQPELTDNHDDLPF